MATKYHTSAVVIPEELHDKVKIALIKHKMSFSKLVRELLAEWLKKV